MIVIPRRRDEGIVVGDDIEIVVVAIRDDKVRLGVSVPQEMPFHQGAVYEALRRSEQGTEAPPPLGGD